MFRSAQLPPGLPLLCLLQRAVGRQAPTAAAAIAVVAGRRCSSLLKAAWESHGASGPQETCNARGLALESPRWRQGRGSGGQSRSCSSARYRALRSLDLVQGSGHHGVSCLVQDSPRQPCLRPSSFGEGCSIHDWRAPVDYTRAAMDPKKQPQDPQQPGPVASGADPARRRLRRGLWIGAGVLLALAAIAILAGVLVKVSLDRRDSNEQVEGGGGSGGNGTALEAPAAFPVAADRQVASGGAAQEAFMDDKEPFYFENQDVQVSFPAIL